MTSLFCVCVIVFSWHQEVPRFEMDLCGIFIAFAFVIYDYAALLPKGWFCCVLVLAADFFWIAYLMHILGIFEFKKDLF